jgi:hypothetical protein
MKVYVTVVRRAVRLLTTANDHLKVLLFAVCTCTYMGVLVSFIEHVMVQR